MPAGIVGDLDVRDCGHRRFEAAGEIALHHLHVVDVGLQMEIVGADPSHEPQGVVAAIEEKARHVAGVDRLDQELDALVASAAKARLATKVSSRIRRSVPGGATPARQLSRAQPSSSA